MRKLRAKIQFPGLLFSLLRDISSYNPHTILKKCATKSTKKYIYFYSQELQVGPESNMQQRIWHVVLRWGSSMRPMSTSCWCAAFLISYETRRLLLCFYSVAPSVQIKLSGGTPPAHPVDPQTGYRIRSKNSLKVRLVERVCSNFKRCHILCLR